ncbi:glycosyltransferase [Bacillus sp. AK128]
MGSNGIKISVITACFNSEKYLEQTIQSVISQTYPNIEYIIVDGASTDKTMDIVLSHKDFISRIVSEKDNGVYDAFNKGIDLATGDVLFFLNSDDYIQDEHVIDDIVRVFQQNKDLQIVYGNVLMKDEETEYFYFLGQSIQFKDFEKGLMPPHPSTFIKKGLFSKHGPFNDNYRIAADFEFLLKCFQTDDIHSSYVDRIISTFRLGGLSSNPNTMKIAKEEKKEIIKQNFMNFEEEIITDNDRNIEFFRMWLEKILVYNEEPSRILKDANIKKVALFGTKQVGIFLMKELQSNGISIITFLDNDVRKHGYKIQGTPINTPLWLLENSNQIDTLILCFEGDFEKEIREQISNMNLKTMINILSWSEIILKSYNTR